MKRSTMASLLALACGLTSAAPLGAADNVITLGISASISGSFAEVGVSTRKAAEMAYQEISAGGGVTVGSKNYSLEMAYVDNASSPSVAAANLLNMIGQKQIMAMVGPQSSNRAVSAGELLNSFKTPMVTPWATSPETTLNRPYVFRIATTYEPQVLALTKYAGKEWKGTKAAVLYDEVNFYPTGMAKAFKQAFEGVNGAGSVVAFETFRTGDTDFSKQVAAIANSGADFLFTPQHYTEVPLIVQQIRKLGWKKPVAGSNSWAGGDLMAICGDACKGLVFTGNFAPVGAKGKAKEFVDKFQKQYKKLPDEVSALTYDAIGVIVQALKNTGGLSGNLTADRTKLRDQLAALKNYQGVTGVIGYHGTGDPPKCTVIVKIDEQGLYTPHDTICP